MQTLDFSKHRRPEMLIVLNDEEQTPVHITAPTKGLVSELKERQHELQQALLANDAQSKRVIYDLAAKLINCNMDSFETTGEELLKKYRLNLDDMAVFYTTYIDFIEIIEKAKN